LLKVGIVGCGAMGQIIAEKIDEGLKGIKLVALCDKEKKRAEKLASVLTHPPVVVDLPSLISASDVVVEATSFEAAPQIVIESLNKGRDVLVLTVGAIFKRSDIFKLAQDKQVKIYLPSGAIAGLDWLKAASLGKISELTLVTRKPVGGLEETPYLKQAKINIANIENEVVLFEGTVEEAIKNFPANINIAATLALAAGKAARVKVKIVADPKLTKNTHQIKAEGELGKINLSVENLPSQINPRSSKLAAFSALALLEEIASPVKIGT